MTSTVYNYSGLPFVAGIHFSPFPHTLFYASPYNPPYGFHLPLRPSPFVPVPLLSSLRPEPLHAHSPLNVTPIKPTANHLLAFDAQNPSIGWDVRLPPSAAITAQPPYRSLSKRQLKEPAVYPPQTVIHLRLVLLPWVVEVSNPTGVTVCDALDAVFKSLSHRVERDEWRNQSDAFLSRIFNARRCRCDMESNKNEQKWNMRRVDWLLGDVAWLGIKRSKTELGTWDVHFRS